MTVVLEPSRPTLTTLSPLITTAVWASSSATSRSFSTLTCSSSLPVSGSTQANVSATGNVPTSAPARAAMRATGATSSISGTDHSAPGCDGLKENSMTILPSTASTGWGVL